MDRGERGPRGDHGQKGETGDRGQRGPRGFRGFGFRVARSPALVYFACFVAIGYSFWTNHNAINQIQEESKGRRDQSCHISESTHKADVEQLQRTYDYLVNLTPRQKRSAINRAVLANLPNVEHAARLDPAPPFCDEPGIGLPEPDPVLPKRPKAL
jgi:hypothetical protein